MVGSVEEWDFSVDCEHESMLSRDFEPMRRDLSYTSWNGCMAGLGFTACVSLLTLAYRTLSGTA